MRRSSPKLMPIKAPIPICISLKLSGLSPAPRPVISLCCIEAREAMLCRFPAIRLLKAVSRMPVSATQSTICVIPTRPKAMIFPIIISKGRTLDTITSMMRFFFSSSTLPITREPKVVIKKKLTPASIIPIMLAILPLERSSSPSAAHLKVGTFISTLLLATISVIPSTSLASSFFWLR